MSKRIISRNLWRVSMEHLSFESLLILAPSLLEAAKKAISFAKKDGVKNPRVKEIKFSGTIDVF